MTGERCWLDPSEVPVRRGGGYPHPYAEPLRGREKRALGDPLGLTQFGVNLVTLPPGNWSSQRHWHANEDEFVYIVEGEVTLVTDAGETILGPGMTAGFPAGGADGHHLINRSDKPVVYLEDTRQNRDGPVQRYRLGVEERGGWPLRLHPQER
jgi:uncharacterized cupin superfamily protein